MKVGPLLPILQKKIYHRQLYAYQLNNLDEMGKESCVPKRYICMTNNSISQRMLLT